MPLVIDGQDLGRLEPGFERDLHGGGPARAGGAPPSPRPSAASCASASWPTGIGDPAVLTDLRVRDLGVIEDLALAFGPGMTALTGETGAGKTLVVGALQLVLGGRATPGLVRVGRGRGARRGPFRGRARVRPSARSSWPAPCPPRDGRGPGSTAAWPR